MSAEESSFYSQALQLYLEHTGKLAQEGSRKLQEKYADIVNRHPEYHQLGFLLALADANSGHYEPFFQRFYLSYKAVPDHFLAFKTKALLHLKLKERAREPATVALESRQVYFYAREAAARNFRDVSLMQMTLEFAPTEEKSRLIKTYIDAILRENIVIARGDLLFFVKEAIDAGQCDSAERFLAHARSWYPTSRYLDAAQEYFKMNAALQDK